ncbi:hypothetical protein CHS0354_001956 [Potamilus streckersoni]|uniref:Uncharacterized protein n=1 Tax=Potamilus streckersoni TaxID=2493646 RepID=A0AAE0T5I6_9BIVA|nr:hypothetical protein CHS0354_001956 [Potamilus streckersoni]
MTFAYVSPTACYLKNRVPTLITSGNGYTALRPVSVKTENFTGEVISENGDEVSFTLKLSRVPTATSGTPYVNVTVSVSDSNEATVNGGSTAVLAFNTSSWNTAQTVRIRGKDDAAADGSKDVRVRFSIATNDNGFNKIYVPDIPLTNFDNDTPNIVYTDITGLADENGGQASFKFGFKPCAVCGWVYTFTPQNWAGLQTVTVTGLDDSLVDGITEYFVRFALSSSDSVFDGITVDSVKAFTIDNDRPDLIISTPDAVHEYGTVSEISVRLASPPSGTVEIAAASSNTGKGILNKPLLTFNQTNWNSGQKVTVTGVNNSITDGDVTYPIRFSYAGGTDGTGYSLIGTKSVNITTMDDDFPGFQVSAAAPDDKTTTESGEQASFNFRALGTPNGTVRVKFTVSDDTEAAAPADVIITPENAGSVHTVFITGKDDNVRDGDIPYTVSMSVDPASGDTTGYKNLQPAVISGFTNTDNDSAGVTVTAVQGGISENGNQAVFSVGLRTEPASDVTVTLASAQLNSEIALSAEALTFTPSSYGLRQVTVTGLPDQPVRLTNTDRDSAQLIVAGAPGEIAEGASGSFTVNLSSRPSAEVRVQITAAPAGKSSVSPGLLIFNPENWQGEQTVLLSAADNAVQDGNTAGTLSFAVTTADINYQETSPPVHNYTVLDNETASIAVSGDAGSVPDIREDGGSAEFTVGLTTQPTAPVSITFSTSPASKCSTVQYRRSRNCTLDGLTFTPDNWAGVQTFMITGRDDAAADGNRPVSVIFTVSAGGESTGYNGLSIATEQFTNTDNDSAGITVTAAGDLSEGGASAQITVVLNSQPSGPVTVNLAGSDTTEASLSASSVTFTDTDWNAPQTVRVAGADDSLADGNRPVRITFSVSSEDSGYKNRLIPPVELTNADDDTAGYTVPGVTGTLTEGASSVRIEFGINTEPFAPVRVSPRCACAGLPEVVFTPAFYEFTPQNWQNTASFTVSSPYDAAASGNIDLDISFEIVSSDSAYAGAALQGVSVRRTDTDSPGITIVKTADGVSEAGGSGNFTAVLNSKPAGEVTVSFTLSNPAEADISPASLTFTPDDFGNVRTVTLTGREDAVADGAQPVRVSFAVSSQDALYSALTAGDLVFSSEDNDSAGINVSAVTGRVSEDGGTGIFTVRLNSEPAGEVRLSIVSDRPDAAVPSPSELIFTAAGWNFEQAVTLSSPDDDLPEKDKTVNITVSVLSSDAPEYRTAASAAASTVAYDNERPAVLISSASAVTDENGRESILTVRLNKEPAAGVIINLAVSDAAEAEISPQTVTLTPDNWNSGAEVTVKGVNDGDEDGQAAYQVSASADVSSAAEFSGVSASYAMRNLDNDGLMPQVTLKSPAEGQEFSAGTPLKFDFEAMEKDGGQYEYLVTVCRSRSFAGCAPLPADQLQIRRTDSAAGGIPLWPVILLLPGLFISRRKGMKTLRAALTAAILLWAVISCQKSGGAKSSQNPDVLKKAVPYSTADYTDASQAGVYYWKVTVQTENQAAESSVGMFIVR